MKRKLDPDELSLVKLSLEYSKESKARKLFESWRWPNGPVCPHCKNHKEKPIYKIKSDKKTKHKVRPGLYTCGACRKTFTATVGTVLEDSHIPLGVWLQAMFILCSSKKSVSSNQLSRMLDVQYRTAWFLSHRIRFAMMPNLWAGPKLKGEVEADETFIGGVGDHKTKHKRHTPVMALIERGGQMRAAVVPNVTQKNLGQVLFAAVDKSATLNTDESGAYKNPGKQFAKHYTVVHARKQYTKTMPDGSIAGVNSCESFFSLLKRGVHGSWHSVSREHLPKYIGEFNYRWNTRHDTDGKRMQKFFPLLEGKRLFYRRPE